MIRVVLAIVLAAVALDACGTVSERPVSPAPTSPSTGFDVLIGVNDRAVAVKVGQKIELVLQAKSGMTDWSGVSVDNTAVLLAVPTGITAPKGVTVAGFEATSTGTATIRATAGPLCSPNQACPMFALLYEVAVTVT